MRPFAIPAILVAAVLALPLSGCAMSDDKLASMLVAPGKFQLYTCPELVVKAKELTKRQQDLEGLMAKAGDGTSGKVVSTLAYRPDYLSARGEMKDVREAAVEKQCDLAGTDTAGPATNTSGAPTTAGATRPAQASIPR